MKRLAVTLWVLMMFVACGGSEGPGVGGAAAVAERGACFANGGCDAASAAFRTSASLRTAPTDRMSSLAIAVVSPATMMTPVSPFAVTTC